jgi:Zn finger protein HypA/HybF involved in hydrogenase expression
MSRKKTPQDYHDLAAQFGNISWVDFEFPKTTKDKTLWLCLSCSHEFQSNYNNIYHSHGCPECAKKKRAQTIRKKPDQYYQLANERDFSWLGPEVSGVMTPTGWQCKKCDHIWQARYSDIKSGRGCPPCGRAKAAAANRLGIDQYHQLAEKRQAIWLGPEVPNTNSDTTWQCQKCDNIWVSPYAYLRTATGCPKCGIKMRMNSRRITTSQYISLANERGFLWLGHKVETTITKTSWECQTCKNVWWASYHSVRKGTGCPRCVESKGEKKIAQILNALNISFEREKRFDRCRDKKMLPFDFYLPYYNILIEYQGEQHYILRKKGYYSDPEQLKERQRRDRIKAHFAQANGLHLIIIPYTDYERIGTIIIDRLTKVAGVSPLEYEDRPGGTRAVVGVLEGIQLPLL